MTGDRLLVPPITVAARPEPQGGRGRALQAALEQRADARRASLAATPSPWRRAALQEGVRRWHV